MKCKSLGNTGICPKKLTFVDRLPFDVLRWYSLAEKIATVKLCTCCPNRYFVLPKYATKRNLVEKYEFLWRNRSLISPLLGAENDFARSDERMVLLALALTKPKHYVSRKVSRVERENENDEGAVLPVLTSISIEPVEGGNPAGNAPHPFDWR